ncbi:MAG: hypothetical protein IIC73_03700 [Armatimonadetes bacterium]|nr:hypothetical protein [Armatimonadota bacterium]
MATDYIPHSDAAFDTWQTNYVTAFAANAAALGFDPLVDVPALTAVQTVWNGSYAAHTTAQAAAVGHRPILTDFVAGIRQVIGSRGQAGLDGRAGSLPAPSRETCRPTPEQAWLSRSSDVLA